jgi:AraC-like DNA-binding protein
MQASPFRIGGTTETGTECRTGGASLCYSIGESEVTSMDLLERMNRALDYIETHLLGDIDPKEVARVACCSEYHFRRTFSYLAGVTLSEHIRRRRLTLAAFELSSSEPTLLPEPFRVCTA